MPKDCPEVAVTGVGMVTCLGASRQATVAALGEGRRVRGRSYSFLAGTPYADFCGVPPGELNVSTLIDNRHMRKFMSPQAELAAVAVRQALLESAPLERGLAAERIGLYAGVGLAGVDTRASISLLSKSLDERGAFSLPHYARSGLRAIHPLWSFHALANMPACIVSVLEKIKGDNGIYTPWEDQSAFALIEASHALGRGDIDCAVAVAVDTPSHPASLVELAANGFITPDEAAAPAAACLVLERPNMSNADRTLFRLANMHLVLEDAPPDDPLAPFVGRTVAAAPLLLAALAPCCGLPCRLSGCGGHRFSFEALQ
jgi:3-oxoacyl-(acyl-carrier-protein) synthase